MWNKHSTYFRNSLYFSNKMLWIYFLHTFSLQGITEPREDWYWPKTETDDDEDDDLKEETEDVEDIVNLTVSL